MSNFKDTYFFSYDEAYKIAKEQNIISSYQKQICYYDGEKRTHNLDNLFSLPFDNLSEELLVSNKRFPTSINFEGLQISMDEVKDVLNAFRELLEVVRGKRRDLVSVMINEIKSFKLDFNEPLRFYLMGGRQTRVIQHISKNIANSLKSMGYDVRFEINNEFEDMNEFRIIKAVYEYMPHVTININNVNNLYLNDDTFNFIWFQDINSRVENLEKEQLRENDYLFHLTNGIETRLKNKNINSQFQPFCLDENIYKPRPNIKKEKKIVFIGNSYNDRFGKIKHNKDYNNILKEVILIYENYNNMPDKEVSEIAKRYYVTEEYIRSFMLYLTRDYCVEKLCSIDTDYTIEIYGNGFEDKEIIKPYYKGTLEHGEDISKVYNSATYAYCPGGYVFMQRTLESAFSGTIPLVLDTRLKKEDGEYNKKAEEGIEFFNIKELELVLKKETPMDKNFDYIIETYSYKYFLKSIIKIIEERKIIN